MVRRDDSMTKEGMPHTGIKEKTHEKPKSVDDILKIIKPFGRYQILISCLYIAVYCPHAVNNMFMGYGGLVPKWTCADPLAYGSNSTEAIQPTQDCSVYKQCAAENLTYISEFYSIVSQWGLVCGEDYMISLITSIQMVGQLVGALITGTLCDLYGRKWTFIVVICLEFSIGGLSALSTSATMFAVFRFLIGVCSGAEMVSAWVFTAETMTNKYRLLIRMAANVLLSYWNQLLLAYLTQNWIWYTVVGNLEGIPVIITLIFFTYESPRWLAQKGRTQEAARVLSEIARINKTSHLLPEKIQLETESKTGQSKKYQVWHLFRTRRLAVYTLVCACNWFAASLVYYGMFFNIGNLGPDIYLSQAIVAAVMMLQLPIGAYDMYNPKSNRKYMMIAVFTLAAVCDIFVCLFQTVFPANDVDGIMTIVSSSIGQVSIGSAFDLCYIYAVELFPTLLRSNANGVMSVGARIGGVIAPQLLFFAETWAPLPYVCFAIVSIIVASIDTFLLPDTRKMHLPETFEQANHAPVCDQNDSYSIDEIIENNVHVENGKY